jgi:hypothetical protein
MAADEVRCHVRLTPHRFFVFPSLDSNCAIEVVYSRLILEIFPNEPHVICMSLETMTACKTIIKYIICANSLKLKSAVRKSPLQHLFAPLFD